MKGFESSAGSASWVGRMGAEDALILESLHRSGAVFFALCTEPQTLVHLECSANIHGDNVNPHNTKLTLRGSSEGEDGSPPGSSAPPQVEVGDALDLVFDVVLCPIGPGVASLLDMAKYWIYTIQWNLLKYPSLVIPTGLYCAREDRADLMYVPRDGQDEYYHGLCKSMTRA